MEKDIVKKELVDVAEQIQHLVKNYSQALHMLDASLYYLKANQEKCHAIGVVVDETYASQLEETLRKALEHGQYLSSDLEKASADYVHAMEGCGLPMTPDFPDEWKFIKP